MNAPRLWAVGVILALLPISYGAAILLSHWAVLAGAVVAIPLGWSLARAMTGTYQHGVDGRLDAVLAEAEYWSAGIACLALGFFVAIWIVRPEGVDSIKVLAWYPIGMLVVALGAAAVLWLARCAPLRNRYALRMTIDVYAIWLALQVGLMISYEGPPDVRARLYDGVLAGNATAIDEALRVDFLERSHIEPDAVSLMLAIKETAGGDPARIRILGRLLDYGVDVNEEVLGAEVVVGPDRQVKDMSWGSDLTGKPLPLAVRQAVGKGSGPHLEVVRMLLERGADATEQIVDEDRFQQRLAVIPQTMAVHGADGQDLGAHYIPLVFLAARDAAVLELLRKHGADPMGSGDDCDSFWIGLADAPVAEVIAVAKLFDVLDHEGVSPLYIFARRSPPDAVLLMRYFLARGLSPRGRWCAPATPLHAVIGEGYTIERIALIEMLLAAGADINARDAKEGTPLDRAGGNAELAAYLAAKGAKTGSGRPEALAVPLAAAEAESRIRQLAPSGLELVHVAIKGVGVSLEGSADSTDRVGSYLCALETSGLFGSVAIETIQSSGALTPGSTTFALNLGLRAELADSVAKPQWCHKAPKATLPAPVAGAEAEMRIRALAPSGLELTRVAVEGDRVTVEGSADHDGRVHNYRCALESSGLLANVNPEWIQSKGMLAPGSTTFALNLRLRTRPGERSAQPRSCR